MENELFLALSSDSGIKVHIAIFTMLALGGVGFPIPEDIPLILAGVAAAKQLVELEKIFLTCYVGVLLADQFVFAIGYFFGKRLITAGENSRFFTSVTPERVEEVREGLRKRRLLYILISRHIFPIRSATFLTAGALRVPFLEFFIADALAALVSVTIMMSVGYFLGESLSPEAMNHIIDKAHWYIGGAALFCLLVFWLSKICPKRKPKRSKDPELSHDVPRAENE